MQDRFVCRRLFFLLALQFWNSPDDFVRKSVKRPKYFLFYFSTFFNTCYFFYRSRKKGKLASIYLFNIETYVVSHINA